MIAATQRDSSVLQEFSYDAWGRRRNPNNWNDYSVTPSSLFTRGFTGHEHINSFDLINMNGRMYDPRLARFLSPDPYVQAPDFTQSFNRYSYVWNNPLRYTDPDGELVWLAPVLIGAAIGAYSGYKIGKANGASGWGMAGYIFGGAAIGGVAGYAGFYVFSAAMAAGSAAGMGGISSGFHAGMLSGMASGAITGGGIAALGGGSFSDIIGGATLGSVMGGLAGGFSGAIAGGFSNRGDGLNFWGNRLSNDISNSYAFLDGVGVNPDMIYFARYDAPTYTCYGRSLIAAAAARDGINSAGKVIFQVAMYGSITATTVGASSAVGGALWRMGARQVGRQVIRNSFSQNTDDLVRTANNLYPKLAGKFHKHHIVPKYLGCAINGPTVRIEAAYHHLITNEFRALHPYGRPKPSPERLQEILRLVYSKFPLP